MDRQDFKNNVFMKIAYQLSVLSTCSRRHVGAVLTRDNMIISTGYNGTPKGVQHCSGGSCDRCASNCDSGVNLDICICTHAEANTIAQAACNGICTNNSILFCTTQPCIDCVKLLINAGIIKIYYAELYSVNYPVELIKNIEIIHKRIQ